MKPVVLILSSAAAHIVFLYSAYGTKFFGLPLSYNAALAFWRSGSGFRRSRPASAMPRSWPG